MILSIRRPALLAAAGLILFGLVLSGPAGAAADEGASKAAQAESRPGGGAAPRSRSKRRPIPAAEGAAPSLLAPLTGTAVPIASVHAPFGSSDCQICHERGDGQRPGPVRKRGNGLCFDCHDEVQGALRTRPLAHRPARDDCGSCHNPHNSSHRSLLLQEPAALCLGCHAPVKEDVDAEVKHPPVHEGRRCLACHDPHAGQAPGLLLAPAYDLCMRCHSSDAGGGKPEPGKSEPGKSEPPSAEAQRAAPRLIDLGRLLRENPVQHAPVAARKCVACHQPHGSSNFRLLVQPYPPKFYAPYDPANYKLCWECHKQALAEEEETTTATQFRDGSRNLHFLHVNKEKGRTCRACHEVHASKQPHQIRDTVPFGAEGWTLELHYTATPTGGICQKTCHGLRSYDHGPLPPAAGR